ncbi:hypothetical protein [Sorangium sp. So ce388]|uniref:hypothetical protein n=1 Tax=Sorangium sp. So ce388 TaxID=3133309 RepID=UPI003F5C7909
MYIQAAVDYLVALTTGSMTPGSVGTLYFPPGNYRIDMPIRITSTFNGAYTFCSINIIGDAPPFGRGSLHGASIVVSYTDKPAIIIQCGRAVRLENLAIIGLNNWPAAWSKAHASFAAQIDSLYDDATFLAQGVTDDSRYAPYAGICIDPFCSPAPLDVYPGLDDFYILSGSGTSGSSSIFIERCHISGFVVGIAISPNQFRVPDPDHPAQTKVVNTQNAENISIASCNISSTKTAIAICQDQSRNVICTNLVVTYAKHAIDCTHYGKGTGQPPSIFGADIGWVKYLFSTSGWGGRAVIAGLYCEVVLSIGVLGRGGYSFDGCNFNLICSSTRPTVGYHLANLGQATFNTCSFGIMTPTTSDSVPLWIFGGLMSFRDCEIGTPSRADNALPFWIHGAPHKVVFDNTVLVQSPVESLFSSTVTVEHMSSVVNQTMLPGCFFHALLDDPDELSPRWVAGGRRSIQLGDAAATNLTIKSDGTATFEPLAPGVVAEGDLIYLRKGYANVVEPEMYSNVQFWPVIGKVTKVAPIDPNNPDQEVVTVGWVPDYVAKGAGANGRPPGAGDMLSVVGFYKVHSPTTSTELVNNTNGKGEIHNVSSAHAWKKGDRIRDVRSPGLPALLPDNTYVAEDPVGGIIKLSQKVTPSSGRVIRFYDAEVRMFSSTQVY